MACMLDVDIGLKQDILDCNAEVRRQLGDFLLALQQNPLPGNRCPLGSATQDSAFYVPLPCGFFVSWEIIGNLMHLALTGETDGLLVRILGVGRAHPK